MAFRVKDLLINVVPQGNEGSDCPVDLLTCGTGTTNTLLCPVMLLSCRTGSTTLLTPFSLLCCTFFSVVGPGVVQPGDPVEQMAALKQQLRQALAQIEAQEAAELQTVEEVEMLQAKLREGIDELDKRKQKLKKK